LREKGGLVPLFGDRVGDWKTFFKEVLGRVGKLLGGKFSGLILRAGKGGFSSLKESGFCAPRNMSFWGNWWF